MITKISEIERAMPWLSPVVLEHSGGDRALHSAIAEQLPAALSAGESYMVHVTPGVIQLQCRDLQVLDRRMAEEVKKTAPEKSFRARVEALYQAVEDVRGDLRGQLGWAQTDAVARRLLDEPALHHSSVVVDFVKNGALSREDFDFDTLLAHRDLLISAPIPTGIFHRLIDLMDDILGCRQRRITHWSAKSRRRMLKGVAELDWAGVLEDCGSGAWQLAMVTLTYPGDWLRYAPDAHTAHSHFKALQERFFRTWGMRLRGVWKREFQKRGAPHLHILMPIPTWGVERPDGGQVFFRQWLSWAWADIVGATGADFVAHLKAGTGVDVLERVTAVKNIAGYFLKYAGKRGDFALKEYQNCPPVEWLSSGVSVGRFWGILGMEKNIRTVLITREEFLAWGRTLSRMVQARAQRKSRIMKGSRAGWILSEDFSDSASIVKNLARFMQCCSGESLSPPVGMRGSVASRLVVA